MQLEKMYFEKEAGKRPETEHYKNVTASFNLFFIQVERLYILKL